MKPVLALFGGFAFALLIFVSGAAVATAIVMARPAPAPTLQADASEVWTDQPQVVKQADQQFRRVEAKPVAPSEGDDAVKPETTEQAGVETDSSRPADTVVTGSIVEEEPESAFGEQRSDEISQAHVEWCADRYRSYRPRDNSYTPYGGGRRTCISPFLDEAIGADRPLSAPPAEADSFEGGEEVLGPVLQYVASDDRASFYVSQDHAQYCYSRYRSYRPEDNSYQPYGGGPRRQCE